MIAICFFLFGPSCYKHNSNTLTVDKSIMLNSKTFFWTGTVLSIHTYMGNFRKPEVDIKDISV